jgi:hypothetical protein
MTETGNTTYESMVSILAELWLDYREDDAFEELFEYADLAFPLAFAMQYGIIDTTERAEGIIHEAFGLLLDTLEAEDDGFDDLNELLVSAGVMEEEV